MRKLKAILTFPKTEVKEAERPPKAKCCDGTCHVYNMYITLFKTN